MGLAVSLGASKAAAYPGQASRLGGIEGQGPASRSITALHHNPAMLAGIEATGLHASFSPGLDQRWIRRNAVDASGVPTADLQDRLTLVNPGFQYFIGGTLYLEPFAIAAGVYTLGNDFQLASADALRYHLAPEPDAIPSQCDGTNPSCGLNGGAMTFRTDFTFAVAWNVLSELKIGLSVHLPRLRTRFAYDNSTALSEIDARCTEVEDPRCAERLGFSGVNRWLPGTSTRPTGIDLALTLGIAYDVHRRVTLGARFRTAPLIGGGVITLAGDAVVCSPTEDGAAASGLPLCTNASSTAAILTQRIAREVALGAAFVIGRAKQWRLDTNLYWVDLCHDRIGEEAGVTNCADAGAQRLTLIDLNPNSSLLHETVRYRGFQDVFGADVYATYQLRSNIALLLSGHVNSPAVRPSATAAGNADSWRVGLSLGTVFRVRQSNVQLIPGYGVDLYVPVAVDPGAASFDPRAATELSQAHGDLNAPLANTVLEGRARPSNAGHYTGLVHTFTIGIRWAERTFGAD